jgi:hypothetical protein
MTILTQKEAQDIIKTFVLRKFQMFSLTVVKIALSIGHNIGPRN